MKHYEEPEEFWYIYECGDVLKYKYDGGCSCPILEAKEIGNYFETKEDAEKVVEKLKAWKRLKETGCKPIKWNWCKPIKWNWKQDYPTDACYVEVVLKCQFDSGVHDKELDLLFGGEE